MPFFSFYWYYIHTTGSFQSRLFKWSILSTLEYFSNMQSSELTYKVLSLCLGAYVGGQVGPGWNFFIAPKIISGKKSQFSCLPFLSLFNVEDCRRKSITLEIPKFPCRTWLFGFIFFSIIKNVLIYCRSSTQNWKSVISYCTIGHRMDITNYWAVKNQLKAEW